MIKITKYSQAFALLGGFVVLKWILKLNHVVVGLTLIALGRYNFYATWHDSRKKVRK